MTVKGADSMEITYTKYGDIYLHKFVIVIKHYNNC